MAIPLVAYGIGLWLLMMGQKKPTTKPPPDGTFPADAPIPGPSGGKQGFSIPKPLDPAVVMSRIQRGFLALGIMGYSAVPVTVNGVFDAATKDALVAYWVHIGGFVPLTYVQLMTRIESEVAAKS